MIEGSDTGYIPRGDQLYLAITRGPSAARAESDGQVQLVTEGYILTRVARVALGPRAMARGPSYTLRPEQPESPYHCPRSNTWCDSNFVPLFLDYVRQRLKLVRRSIILLVVFRMRLLCYWQRWLIPYKHMKYSQLCGILLYLEHQAGWCSKTVLGYRGLGLI